MRHKSCELGPLKRRCDIRLGCDPKPPHLLSQHAGLPSSILLKAKATRSWCSLIGRQCWIPTALLPEEWAQQSFDPPQPRRPLQSTAPLLESHLLLPMPEELPRSSLPWLLLSTPLAAPQRRSPRA